MSVVLCGSESTARTMASRIRLIRPTQTSQELGQVQTGGPGSEKKCP